MKRSAFPMIISIGFLFVAIYWAFRLIERIKYYFDKPKRIIMFREEVAKIRNLIKSGQAVSANDNFKQLRCPSNEHLGEYEKVKNEFAAAMAKYDEEEKRQREIREEEQRKQQQEKERIKRQQYDALVLSGKIIDSFSSQEFELEVLEAFSRQGYKTTHTSYSGDEGVDGFIEKGNTRMAIQCKKYSDNIIGSPAIREFLGSMVLSECEEGIFITTSDFSSQAKAVAENKNIQLFNREMTLNLLQSTLNNGYDDTEDSNEGLLPFPEANDLRQRLWEYNEEIIIPKYPDRSKCILREEMLDYFVDTKPLTIGEFIDCIPRTLRDRTDQRQMESLGDIFDIIDDYISETSEE